MRLSTLALTLALALWSLGCATARPRPLLPDERAAVEAEVASLALAIAADLRAHGPAGWLPHFVQGEGFTMASDGQLVFPDWPTARDFVQGLDARTASMELAWGDLQIEPLARDLALLRGDYAETITATDGSAEAFEGYMSALAVRGTDRRWRLRHLHWSSPPPAP